MTRYATFHTAALVILLLGNFLGSAVIFAQGDGSVTLSAETMKHPVDLGDVLWRFRAGDDPAWADPGFDDTDWELMDTDFQPDSLYDVWQGLGWFRLHLQVDSTLFQTTLGLSTYQLGASEIYINGERIEAFGFIGESAEQDLSFAPKGLPLFLHLDDRPSHVLAVRFSNRMLSARTIALYQNRPFLPSGFSLVIGPKKQTTHSYIFSGVQIYIDALIMGVLLLILCLHVFLYLFDRRELVNLNYALAVAGLCVAHLAGHMVGYRTMVLDGSVDLPFLSDLGNFGFVVFMTFLLATMYALFSPALLRKLRWWIGIWLLGWTAWFAFAESYTTTVTDASFFIFPVMAEALRVSVLAAYRRKEGSWILTGALLFTLFAMLYALLSSGLFLDVPGTERTYLLESHQLVAPIGVWLMLFYFPLPVGMSALLARRFVKRSKRLEQELERVEELSEQSLAQEREKQLLIASQNERLEAEVEARTAALKQSQQQLVHAEKMASLGALTAGIAHEIKNPLNFINNFAEINEELAQELRHAVENGEDLHVMLDDLEQNASLIKQHGKRADSIVHAMMQHASGGTGQREQIDINQLVAEHIDLAYHGKRAQVPDLIVEMRRDLDENVGVAEVVPQEIGRVLLNLLGNAFDAVHEHSSRVGGAYEPEVMVSTRRVDDKVEIRVSDNGPGIPEQIKDKIFEPFFTTKPTDSGTGLGLSLSYDIVTQGHGGTLTVESEEGKGATFVVTLPANQTVRDVGV